MFTKSSSRKLRKNGFWKFNQLSNQIQQPQLKSLFQFYGKSEFIKRPMFGYGKTIPVLVLETPTMIRALNISLYLLCVSSPIKYAGFGMFAVLHTTSLSSNSSIFFAFLTQVVFTELAQDLLTLKVFRA